MPFENSINHLVTRDIFASRSEDNDYEMPPPWVRFPGFTQQGSYRCMGNGENGWLYRWLMWRTCRLRSRADRLRYLRRYPKAPRIWAEKVYTALESTYVRALPEGAMADLIQMGLVGDDVAFDTWALLLGPSGIPPWCDLRHPNPVPRSKTPESAMLYTPRALGFWARWVLLQRQKRADSGWRDGWEDPPSEDWARFCMAAASGEVIGADDLRGVTRLVLELAAHGAPPPPWRLELSTADIAAHKSQAEPSYSDGWVRWVEQSFDDPTTWQAYLRHRGPIPQGWEWYIRQKFRHLHEEPEANSSG